MSSLLELPYLATPRYAALSLPLAQPLPPGQSSQSVGYVCTSCTSAMYLDATTSNVQKFSGTTIAHAQKCREEPVGARERHGASFGEQLFIGN